MIDNVMITRLVARDHDTLEGNHHPINDVATLQTAHGLPVLSPAPEPTVVD